MKLIRCYIENFGKIKEFSYEFKDGLNIVNEQNGWGKTTFATFIKAMFYGLEYTTRRSLDKNERKKFLPWQGGKFGGNLEFEINGNIYKIERFFGAKEKDDTFKLYNQKTHLKSKDYSENIGEEIFKIDKASFERSTYIPQENIQVEINDSISAKLSNILESNNDIESSDGAIKILDDKIKEYKKKGDKGKIYDTADKIRELMTKLEHSKSDEEKLSLLKNKISEINNIIEQINVQKTGKQKELKQLLESQGKVAKYNMYEQLCDDYNQNIKKFEPINDFFHNEIPEIEDLDNYTRQCIEIERLRNEIKSYGMIDNDLIKLNNLKQLFDEGIPKIEDIDKCIELLNEAEQYDVRIAECYLTPEDKENYERLNVFFGKEMLTEEKIDSYFNEANEIEELKRKIDVNDNRLKMLEEFETNQKKLENKDKGNVIFFLISAICILLGILLSRSVQTKIGLPVIVIGIAVLVMGVFQKIKIKKSPKKDISLMSKEDIMKEKNELMQKKNELEDDLTDFVDKFAEEYRLDNIVKCLTQIKTSFNRYNDLARMVYMNHIKINDYKERKNTISLEIDQILGKYYKYFENQQITQYEMCKKIEDKVREYEDTNIKLQKLEKYNQTLKTLENEIKLFLNKYYDNISDDFYNNYIEDIKLKRNDFYNLKEQVEQIKNKKQVFEKENDIKDIQNLSLSSAKSEDIENIINELDTQLNNYNDEKNYLKNQLELAESEIENISDIESEIEYLQDDLEVYIEKCNILEKTKKYLEKAKQDFSSHYLTTMSNGFQKYVNMINGEELQTDIDVNLNVKIEQLGSKMPIEYFSTGYKDLVGICMRFALVEALFENETPFIMLDDPFVNLDEDKLRNALDLIEQIGQKYQIIYFICHSSRA